MVAVTLDTITTPVTGGNVASASAGGTTDDDTNTVTVTVADELGNTASAGATVAAGAWSIVLDLSALVDGPLLWQVTATDAGPGLSAFAARAGEKSLSNLTELAYSVVNSPWSNHLDVLQDYLSAGISSLEMDQACTVASDLLFLLTGQAWPGIGTDFVWPQARWRKGIFGWEARLDGAPWAQYGYCSCNRGRETGCTRVPEIQLPHNYVDAASVVVHLDGVDHDIDSGLFRLDDKRWLVRLDGNGWPCCQPLSHTALGAWSVAFDWGIGPDIGGVIASATLGYELALSRAPKGADKCRLPKRVKTITRAGTTLAVLDPLSLFKDGLTGITEVDLWVASKMLGKQRAGGSVIRPFQTRPVRRTDAQ